MMLNTNNFFRTAFFVLVGILFLTWFFAKKPILESLRTVERDTLLVMLPPEIIIKDSIVYRWKTITDSSLFDSLETYKNWYSNLIDSLEEGKVVSVFDTTKFNSGDSLVVRYDYYPLNRFSYLFFPRPDKTITIKTTIENYYDTSPVFSLYLGGGINFDAAPYRRNGEIIGLGPELIGSFKIRGFNFLPYIRYGFQNSNSVGMMYSLNMGGKKINK